MPQTFYSTCGLLYNSILWRQIQKQLKNGTFYCFIALSCVHDKNIDCKITCSLHTQTNCTAASCKSKTVNTVNDNKYSWLLM